MEEIDYIFLRDVRLWDCSLNNHLYSFFLKLLKRNNNNKNNNDFINGCTHRWTKERAIQIGMHALFTYGCTHHVSKYELKTNSNFLFIIITFLILKIINAMLKDISTYISLIFYRAIKGNSVHNAIVIIVFAKNLDKCFCTGAVLIGK